MRISDWSSDVCSSDLELLHPDPPRLVAHPLGAGEDVAHGIEVVGVRHLGIAGEEGVGAEQDGGIGVVGEHRHDAIVQRRSEEHTSELQSLMRISYAVFCLKKKKNIKNEIHTVA